MSARASRACRSPGAACLLALLAGAVVGDLAGARFALHHGEGIAGIRRAVEAKNLDRHRRAGLGTCSPRSLIRARTRPHSAPATTISPRCRVPRLHQHGRHRAAAAIELGLDHRAFGRRGRDWPSGPSLRPAAGSPRAARRGSSLLGGRDLDRLSDVAAQHSTAISYCSSSLITRVGSASGLSILLMATMIGTFAALACWIASMVCGITPSSAATTSTTMSVTLAPRARMAVKAAWPGVSRKVILRADRRASPDRRRCAG